MKDKLTMAVNWAGACGGCDVSILDIEDKIFSITKIADIIYWPVAMDFKRKDLAALEPDSIDITLFNGMIRNSEHLEDAKLLREKSKVMVAFGSCAHLGGIPGMANFTDRQGIFDVSYITNPSTGNPDGTLPLTRVDAGGRDLTLPEFHDQVRALDRVVDVDYYVPGCPPPFNVIMKTIEVVSAVHEGGDLPARGSVIADRNALCGDCPRKDTVRPGLMENVVRPHEKMIDPDTCFLEQGIICMGPFTRGGCGHLCIEANMPCRGCFGPAEKQYDQGTEALSAFGSVVSAGRDDYVPRGEMLRPVNKVKDPLGTFYRFSLPSAIINRNMKEGK
ncbi:MAG: oxidoreductase [Thermodesulfobacteriota bacterium]